MFSCFSEERGRTKPVLSLKDVRGGGSKEGKGRGVMRKKREDELGGREGGGGRGRGERKIR